MLDLQQLLWLVFSPFFCFFWFFGCCYSCLLLWWFQLDHEKHAVISTRDTSKSAPTWTFAAASIVFNQLQSLVAALILFSFDIGCRKQLGAPGRLLLLPPVQQPQNVSRTWAVASHSWSNWHFLKELIINPGAALRNSSKLVIVFVSSSGGPDVLEKLELMRQ